MNNLKIVLSVIVTMITVIVQAAAGGSVKLESWYEAHLDDEATTCMRWDDFWMGANVAIPVTGLDSSISASESLMGGDYKFKDYYSAFSKDRYRIVDIREDMPASILESTRNGFEASQNEVARIQDSLVQSFPYNQKMV